MDRTVYQPNQKKQTGPVSIYLWLFFLGLHIPLAFLMSRYEIVSTVHAIATLLVGVYFILNKQAADKIPLVTAYIVGAEVLWRMTGANVFWEYGKYAIVALAGLSLFAVPKKERNGLPVAYFFLLLLSVPLTLTGLELAEARDEISFNLSGPLCLAVSYMFFSQVGISAEKLRSLVWMLVAPLIGMTALSLYQIYITQYLSFSNMSNAATSGGFGPNQVSAVLGLGSTLMLLLAIQESKWFERLVALGIGLGLGVFCVITFSRGGFYNIVAALLAAGVISLKNPKMRSASFSVLILAAVAGGVYIYPKLNDFTGGMLVTRFTNFDTTHRFDIMMAEMEAWMENPILGTGPGMGMYTAYERLGAIVAAHTEYTRMIAEHGIPGIISMLLMAVMAIQALRHAPDGMPKVWTAALIAWSLVEMSHAAMRIAAIGYLFGLAAAWSPREESVQQEQISPAWKQSQNREHAQRNNPTPYNRQRGRLP